MIIVMLMTVPAETSSGMRKLDAIVRNAGENGPMDAPSSTTCVRPRNTSSPDRVTRNAGMSKYAIHIPCHAPMAMPTIREMSSVGTTPMP